jgi:hypothetical protein
MDKHIEYRSEVLKISGFAMLAPAGRIFYESIALVKECGVGAFILYVLLAIITAKIGMWCIIRGYKVLKVRKYES